MIMRYLQLAIVAATAASTFSLSLEPAASLSRNLAGDFDWDIQPEDGYPVIAFSNSTETGEAIFKYNFTGTLDADVKYLTTTLYKTDCSTLADDAGVTFAESVTGDELDIDVNVIQATVVGTDHYQGVNSTNAAILFCVRVDYYYKDPDDVVESVNFYETNVTINVDLTANFTLSGITADRTLADTDEQDAILDYPVEAYICDGANALVGSPDPLAQGSDLQVCVKIDDTVTVENVNVEDILLFVMTQAGSAEEQRPIEASTADALTTLDCAIGGGICNVRTQVLSKFFTATNPGALQVDGIAILSFGAARRRLRAPLRGLLKAEDVRRLQAGGESDFAVQVGLQGANGETVEGDDGANTAAIAAVVVLVAIAAAVGLFFFFRTKSRGKSDVTIQTHTNSIQSEPASAYSNNNNNYYSDQPRNRGTTPSYD
jgi:hypothetical protein